MTPKRVTSRTSQIYKQNEHMHNYNLNLKKLFFWKHAHLSDNLGKPVVQEKP